jgi:hypothetical protein
VWGSVLGVTKVAIALSTLGDQQIAALGTALLQPVPEGQFLPLRLIFLPTVMCPLQAHLVNDLPSLVSP